MRNKAAKEAVSDYIASVESPGRRQDAERLVALYREVTGWEPAMWGPTIVGFGRYAYTYESGHSGETFVLGFAPRKANMVLYTGAGFPKKEEMVEALGKHKRGVGCIYLGRLTNVDMSALEKLLRRSLKEMTRKHDCSTL